MADDQVTVSMYNVGFGDCFLIRIPDEDREENGERRILIDCGSIKRGIEGGTDAVVERLIADVTDDDGRPRIDVVVATHRHKDHVSGFTEELWRTVEVDEVWLPWTENHRDPNARRILEEMAGFAMRLDSERRSLQLDDAPELELIDHVLENTLELSNEKAMTTLLKGFLGGRFRARRRFLKRQAAPLESKALPGITVHVLGPSDDESVIRDMNPPSAESFLRAAETGADLPVGDSLPFPTFDPPLDDKRRVSGALKDRLGRMSLEAALLGAVSLEKAVNNTSLMLAFEIGDAVLLFPGDAQWGAWDLNLSDADTRELLSRTTFYKIGHHGSHNANPVSFVNDVLKEGNEPVAAVSVTEHGRFTEIPKAELIEHLEERIGEERVVRSDRPPAAEKAIAGLHVELVDGDTGPASDTDSVEEGATGPAIRIDFPIAT